MDAGQYCLYDGGILVAIQTRTNLKIVWNHEHGFLPGSIRFILIILISFTDQIIGVVVSHHWRPHVDNHNFVKNMTQIPIRRSQFYPRRRAISSTTKHGRSNHQDANQEDPFEQVLGRLRPPPIQFVAEFVRKLSA